MSRSAAARKSKNDPVTLKVCSEADPPKCSKAEQSLRNPGVVHHSQLPQLRVAVVRPDGTIERVIKIDDPRKIFCELFNEEYKNDPRNERAFPMV